MLERLHIENYKCLRNVTVDLDDFTILIGPNDSGKSSFLQAFKSLGSMVGQQFPPSLRTENQLIESLVWQRQGDLKIKWEISGKANQQNFVYQIELPAKGGPPSEHLTFGQTQILATETINQHGREQVFNVFAEDGKPQQKSPAQPNITFLGQRRDREPHRSIVNAISSSIEYHFEIDKLQGLSFPRQGEVLQSNGANIAGILDVMQNDDRSSFQALEREFHSEIPTLGQITVPPVPNTQGAKALAFVLAGSRPSVRIPADQVSDGVLLLTAFLTLAYTETSDILLFEEPENGLHPSRLRFVVDLLRKISSGEVGGRKRQVIITTHSPLLLNYAKPEEVRVFIRDSPNGSVVRSMAQVPGMNALGKEFAVGELWYLLGESNLFKEPAK